MVRVSYGKGRLEITESEKTMSIRMDPIDAEDCLHEIGYCLKSMINSTHYGDSVKIGIMCCDRNFIGFDITHDNGSKESYRFDISDCRMNFIIDVESTERGMKTKREYAESRTVLRIVYDGALKFYNVKKTNPDLIIEVPKESARKFVDTIRKGIVTRYPQNLKTDGYDFDVTTKVGTSIPTGNSLMFTIGASKEYSPGKYSGIGYATYGKIEGSDDLIDGITGILNKL